MFSWKDKSEFGRATSLGSTVINVKVQGSVDVVVVYPCCFVSNPEKEWLNLNQDEHKDIN